MRLRSGNLRTRFLITGVVVVLIILAHNQISRMDERFFHFSVPGVKGLLLYLVGNYSKAAKAYRDHFKQLFEEYESVSETDDVIALLRGKLESGKILAQKALEADFSAIYPLLTLGEVALEEKYFEQALGFFGLVLQREPDQFDALLLSSVAYTHQGDYGKAIDTLNRALRYNKVGTRITAFLTALETTGDLSRLPSKIRPFCLLAHYHRYLRIFDPSNARLAIRYATQAIEAGDRPADAYLTLGIIHSKYWKTEDALQAFLKALEIEPKHPEALRWASRTYGKRGDLENEYRFMKAAYEAAPMDFHYVNNFDDLLREKLGDYHQALAVNVRALSVNPENAEALTNLGYIYNFLGDYQKSVEYYRRATVTNPRSYAAYEGLGYSLRELKQTKEAVAAFKNSIAINPSRPNAHIGLANTYHLERRYRDAIPHYEEAFRLGERDVGQMNALCGLYLKTSNFAQAVACSKRVLSRRPKDISANNLLSDALKNLELQGKR